MRYEIKYVLPPAYDGEIERQVLHLPCGFHEIYHERQVNNIYLDTPELCDYSDAVNGVSSRSKTRIRWYGNFDRITRPMLEVKFKRGLVGSKHVEPFDMFTLQNAAELSVDRRVPRLVNAYTRRYFATPDEMCRITIDKEQKFYSPASAAMGEQFGIADNRILLEVKFKKDDLYKVANAIQQLNLHIGKNSKYVNGINAVMFLRTTY
ncbi:VTC domain-containing protein [Spirochaetia bacterium]|nr:VTC domain-containing protein [Spirochaetia bacterium]